MSDYYFPQELVVEIFKKLPVKSLLQFRCVCKSWCSLISSPDFIRSHTLGLGKTAQQVLFRTSFIFGGKDYYTRYYTFYHEDQLPLSSSGGYPGVPARSPGFDAQIAGSCNGILCLDYFGKGICLWNFSVQRQLMIPELAFQSKPSNVTVGFGFDPITNDYKILTIYYDEKDVVPLRVFLYTLNAAFWSEIAPPSTRFYIVETESCFVNGTLHWGVNGTLDWGVECHSPESPHFIMTFDLSTHIFGTISLPKPVWETSQLAVINDSLAVICVEGDYDTWIWVRKESNHVLSWSVFLKLRTPGFEVGRVLQPSSDGDLLILLVSMEVNGNGKVYNPRTGVLSTLLDFGSFVGFEMETYVESLGLLDRGTPCSEATDSVPRYSSLCHYVMQI